MNFRHFTAIIEANGFKVIRQVGSHRQYEGCVSGARKMVTVAYHSIGDDIHPKTLASMIRQSGLSKKLFR